MKARAGTVYQQEHGGEVVYVVQNGNVAATTCWQTARHFADRPGWRWVQERDDAPDWDMADYHDLVEAVEDHARGVQTLSQRQETLALTHGLAIPAFGSDPEYRLLPRASRPGR